jgi:hypothetical protein
VAFSIRCLTALVPKLGQLPRHIRLHFIRLAVGVVLAHGVENGEPRLLFAQEALMVVGLIKTAKGRPCFSTTTASLE